eukprot:2489373-Amphidinium_carterae.2
MEAPHRYSMFGLKEEFHSWSWIDCRTDTARLKPDPDRRTICLKDFDERAWRACGRGKVRNTTASSFEVVVAQSDRKLTESRTQVVVQLHAENTLYLCQEPKKHMNINCWTKRAR